mgnify:CR=1 FL=1
MHTLLRLLHCKNLFNEHIVFSFYECIISCFDVFANGLLEKFTMRLQLIEDYKLVCLVIRNNILCRQINESQERATDEIQRIVLPRAASVSRKLLLRYSAGDLKNMHLKCL